MLHLRQIQCTSQYPDLPLGSSSTSIFFSQPTMDKDQRDTSTRLPRHIVYSSIFFNQPTMDKERYINHYISSIRLFLMTIGMLIT